MSGNFGRHVGKFWLHFDFSDLRPTWSNPDSERMVCKTYIFINSNFYYAKTESGTKTLLQSFGCFE